jgi:hypothetical protein
MPKAATAIATEPRNSISRHRPGTVKALARVFIFSRLPVSSHWAKLERAAPGHQCSSPEEDCENFLSLGRGSSQSGPRSLA